MPSLLMCDPLNFGVQYEINPWMSHQIGAVDSAQARTQWHALHGLLSSLTSVAVMPSVPGWPDLVFTANAGLIVPGERRVILSTFRHPERKGELPLNRAWFEAHGWQVETLKDVAFEGAGDALFDTEGRLWVAEGPRTDQGVLSQLQASVGSTTIGLKLVDPRYYHLDTCFCPMPRGFALANLTAFDQASQDWLTFAFQDKLIPLTEEESAWFCGNAVFVENVAVMNRCTPRLRSVLAERGFLTLTTPLSEFIKSGGSAKCLTLALG